MLYVVGYCYRVEQRGPARLLKDGGWRIMSGPHRSFSIAGEKRDAYAGQVLAIGEKEVLYVSLAEVSPATLLQLYGLADPGAPAQLPLDSFRDWK